MHVEAMNWSGMGHAEYAAALGLSRHALRELPQEYSREDETIEIADDWEIPKRFLTKSDIAASAVMYDDLYMNSDVIEAVHEMYADFGHKGYNLHSNFTSNFNYDKHLVKASNPPYTMCVSSQFEIILKAIIRY